jgi:hypothetical protein
MPDVTFGAVSLHLKALSDAGVVASVARDGDASTQLVAMRSVRSA